MQTTDNDKDEANRLNAEEKLSREGKKYFKFTEFDAQEVLVTEIRKHPIGLFMIFLTGALIILAILAVGLFGALVDLGEAVGSDAASGLSPIFTIISLLLIIGAAIAVFIGAFLYVNNVIFVTNEKIAQVLYISLFNRKVSQLSIGDVQDVTITQKGIFAHFFNYGTLVIETAGEQENYTFTFIPDPYSVSKLIVGAHEKNLELHGN